MKDVPPSKDTGPTGDDGDDNNDEDIEKQQQQQQGIMRTLTARKIVLLPPSGTQASLAIPDTSSS